MDPTEDITPIRAEPVVPDAGWFPCPHCGRAIKCPPVARPVRTDTIALKPTVVAEELNPPPGATTKIIHRKRP